MNHADARKKTIAKPTNRISICPSSQMAERYQTSRKNGVKNNPLPGTKRRTAVRYGFDACPEYLSAFGALDRKSCFIGCRRGPLTNEARRRPSSGVLPRSIAVFE
jgi:hypothetical protein